jgi:hypothetical protein
MKYVSILTLFLLSFAAFGQASVAYYPFGGSQFIAVSSNPNRLAWIDARVQTNTLFGSLSTTLAPMINVRRTPNANYYIGASVRVNALNTLVDDDILEGYALHVGVRVAVPYISGLRAAFELSPYSNANFKSGVFYSHLGLAYQFRKK